jgi:hypothetical protein
MGEAVNREVAPVIFDDLSGLCGCQPCAQSVLV